MEKIIIDTHFEKALHLMDDTDQSIFLTGKAGTGKSTLLKHFLETSHKNVAVLAPTGVAALNVGGVTIHSFLGLPPGVTYEKAKMEAKHSRNKKMFNELNTIIVDEISMVRADLLDCMHIFLSEVRKNKKPFGGLQMIFIGDLYQLPPVITSDEKDAFYMLYETPYFFSAEVIQEQEEKAFHFIELEKVYRQSDLSFITILDSIRKNLCTDKQLSVLNEQVAPEDIDCVKGYIYLTSTNAIADRINEENLDQIHRKVYEFAAEIKGNFDRKLSPTQRELQIKIDAQVMLLNNHPQGEWVNGSIGKITEIDGDSIYVELQEGNIVCVEKYKWPLFKYTFNEETKKLEQEELGSFKQYPIKLAWAITIHKSQGKTFDQAIIDIGKGAFATGQTYVALSRCRTLEGIILKKPIMKRHVMMDYRVVKYLTDLQYTIAEEACSLEDKIKIVQDAIDNKKTLQITYLKASDEKSHREISPISMGDHVYQNKTFFGMKAFCSKRKEERIFRLERILAIETAKL